ncbi:transposase [Aeromicrobium sp. UC242_57]|uniref:transposase n=1 Tax=Aeromicrobium sp. UC242_57 TaxID=3374624 RepID=UPI0037B7D20A
MLVETCARLRPTTDLHDPHQALKLALRRLAKRCQYLADEIDDADTDLKTLITLAAPRLLEQIGVGPEVAGQLLVSAGDNPDRLKSEASFAALCGVSPLPASSGRTDRHRLNRGGDRAANCALYTVTMVRMRYDERTRAYVQRRTTQGLTKPEIMRCLKRYIARGAPPRHPRSTRPARPASAGPGPTNPDRRLTIYRSIRTARSRCLPLEAPPRFAEDSDPSSATCERDRWTNRHGRPSRGLPGSDWLSSLSSRP